MATLAVVNAAKSGVEVVAGAAACAAGGDTYPNTGQEIAIITNNSVGTITVTVATPNKLDGHDIADRTVAIAPSTTEVLGPYPPGTYNNASGQVALTYTGVTTLFIKVLKVTPA